MEDEWCRCCPRRTFTQGIQFKQWKNVWRKLLIAHQRNVLLKRTSHHFCHHRLLSFKFFLCTRTIIVNIFTKKPHPDMSSCFIFTILQIGNSPKKKCRVPSDWKIFWFFFENQTNNRSPKATSQSWVNKAPRKSTVQSSVIITSHCYFFLPHFLQGKDTHCRDPSIIWVVHLLCQSKTKNRNDTDKKSHFHILFLFILWWMRLSRDSQTWTHFIFDNAYINKRYTPIFSMACKVTFSSIMMVIWEHQQQQTQRFDKISFTYNLSTDTCYASKFHSIDYLCMVCQESPLDAFLCFVSRRKLVIWEKV